MFTVRTMRKNIVKEIKYIDKLIEKTFLSATNRRELKVLKSRLETALDDKVMFISNNALIRKKMHLTSRGLEIMQERIAKKLKHPKAKKFYNHLKGE